MKWIGGAVLLVITIILLIMSLFIFPWYTTETKYDVQSINDNNPDYWDEKLDGVEHEWDKSTYYIQHYELESSTNLDWTRNNENTSSNSGKIEYNSPVSEGGWDGSYRDMVKEDYPVPGYLVGGEEQLNVFNYTYYMLLLSIILTIVGIICIAIAGTGKITPTLPKVIVVIAAIFIVLAPVYFALGLPLAINTDFEEYQLINKPPGNATLDDDGPPEGGSSIMGEANERSDGGTILSKIEWGPGFSWFFAIGAIFTSIITLGFIEGKQPEPDTTPDTLKRRYHEFDTPYDRSTRRRQPSRRSVDYDQEYIPPPGKQRGGFYDDYGLDRGRGGGGPPPRPPARRRSGPPPRPPRRGSRPPPGY
jgi:hypothetical protein